MTKKQTRSLVAFDLDDTLVDTFGYILARLPSRPAPKKWYDPDELGISDKQLWALCSNAFKAWGDVPIIGGAEGLVRRLYELSGDPITIITARPSTYASHTYKLIDRFCNAPYRIAFTGHRSKLPHLHGFEYYVEDRRKTAIDLGKKGIKVIMPKRSYNEIEHLSKRPVGVKRVGALSTITNRAMDLVDGLFLRP